MEKGELIGKGRTAEIYAWGSDRVLKLYFDWCLAEWAEYEATVQHAVHAAGIPSPKVDEIVHINGRRGIIMERVAGPTMLDVLEKQPWRLSELAGIQAELHAEVHNCHVTGLEKAGAKLWGMIARATSIPNSSKQWLMTRLVSLPDGDAVCHYDFHPMNVIMSPRGPVIIDWMAASAGNPLLDISRTWLVLTHAAWPFGFPYNIVITPMRRIFYAVYFRRYRQLRPVDMTLLEECRQVTVAARLGENIPAETDLLLALLRLPQGAANAA